MCLTRRSRSQLLAYEFMHNAHGFGYNNNYIQIRTLATRRDLVPRICLMLKTTLHAQLWIGSSRRDRMIRIKCTLHSISADAGELNRPIDRDYLLHGRYKCVVEISPKPDNTM